MVVREDDRRRIALQRPLDDLPRVDVGPVHRPEKQFLESEQAMPGIEKQAREHLPLEPAEFRGEEQHRIVRTGEGPAVHQPAGRIAGGDRQDGLQARDFGRPETLVTEQQPDGRIDDAAHGAVLRQQPMPQRQGAVVAGAGAQQHRQQLGVGEPFMLRGQQPLARPLRGKPVPDRIPAHGIAAETHALSINGVSSSRQAPIPDEIPLRKRTGRATAANSTRSPAIRVIAHNCYHEPMDLSGKHILLGVTGGIAAYKTPILVRLLRQAGADVEVVLTRSASEFVTPTTLQAVSGPPRA